MEVMRRLSRQVNKHAQTAATTVLSLTKTCALAAVLPVAIGIFSQSRIVIVSSGALLLAGLLTPLLPHRSANFAVFLLMWVAALLVALSGFRTRMAEKRVVSLEHRIREYESEWQIKERGLLRHLSETDGNPTVHSEKESPQRTASTQHQDSVPRSNIENLPLPKRHFGDRQL
jgi:hypothetical protein